MSLSQKSKKSRAKQSQSHPISSSIISQPVVEDASQLAGLSCFSPDGNMFAFVLMAVDKHRLRIYNTSSGKPVANHIIDSARVSTLIWSTLLPSADESVRAPDDEAAQPSRKKRKKRDVSASSERKAVNGVEVAVLGLTDGTVLFFSPAHGRVLNRLSNAGSSSGILSIAIPEDKSSATLWTSNVDGTIQLWDIYKNAVMDSWKDDGRAKITAISVRPTEEENKKEILAAGHEIHLLSKTGSNATRQATLASFTGHSSQVKLIKWDVSKTPSERFLSMAEGERFIYVWDIEGMPSTRGSPSAHIPLDANPQTFALSSLPGGGVKQTLATLSKSGVISIFPIPEQLAPVAGSTRTPHNLVTLLPRSKIIPPSNSGEVTTYVVDISFDKEREGGLRVAKLIGGARPVFDVIRYLDESGNFIPEVLMSNVEKKIMSTSPQGITNERYAETSSVAVGFGNDLAFDDEMDDSAIQDIDGNLEVNLAEMSLGQRLTVQSEADARRRTSDSDDEDISKSKLSKKKAKNDINVVPANSLTRTLIQALHSSDARLLETCLAHSDPTLIRNTVRRLPPQLAIPLITACVDRLSRGARAANMKGGGGGASSQRGMGLINWVQIVLAVHAGHLMTVPDLVARLSGLYSTLSARLSLYDGLMSLNGRLDMVLSQIEMRSSAAPTPLAPRKEKMESKVRTKDVKRYVEGESSDEDEGAPMEVEVGDDEGSVEDVELGGDSEEDEDEDEDDSEEGSEINDEDDSEGGLANGFIDDEAEEDSEEEESD